MCESDFDRHSGNMIRLREYDAPTELPEKPLKEWRAKFEANTLPASEFMQFFHNASPFFFTIDQAANYSDLGELLSFELMSYSVFVLNANGDDTALPTTD